MDILKNNLTNKLILFISILFLLSISLSSVNAAETNITSSDNLGQTIADAGNGDTINLDTGTYTNNVTNITINKNLTLKGNGSASNVVIDAQKIGRIFNITPGNTLTLINITLTNGQAPEAALFANSGGAIYVNGGTLTTTNCIFTNNNATHGGAIYNNNSSSNIANSKFINNTAVNEGGAIASDRGNLTILDSIFENNSALYGAIDTGFTNILTINSTFINNTAFNGGAILVHDLSNATIINSSFRNNIAEDSGGAIFHDFRSKLNITNSNFTNNTASFGGAISDDGDNTNITNSNFINNTATFAGSAIYSSGNNLTVNRSNFTNNKGSVIYIGGINTTIQSSNIYNNTQGIVINSEAENTVINYNRIFNNTNTTGFNLNNNGLNTNANLNWWGDNNPLVSGIILDNYFVMNVTNLTSTVTNGSARFNYTFGLNTNDPFDVSLLPYFVTNVYTNVTSGIQQTFDARFNRTVTIDTDKGGQNVTYTFVTDNEVKNISLFVEPTPTNLEVNNPKGKDGETVELIAKLTDEDGNPIAGKLITFHVGSMTLTAITDANGIARVLYTIDADDFTDGKLSFTATFEGDENYLASTATGLITLIEEPIPPEPPEPTPENETNETNNNSAAASVAMKETGIPVNVVLALLLSILGVLIGRKRL